MRICENEGHGRLDGKRKETELLVTKCRYNFPKNPIDKAEMIVGFPKDYDKTELKKAKDDYLKIRKYLLRLTHGENFRDTEQWSNFENMNFYEYLYEIGMFEDTDDINDEKVQQKARRRYLTALRCEVRSTGMLLLKRETSDVFTNNFNKKLIQVHQANQDVQYVIDEYSVAEYISDYCTKQESGQSALLKRINDEAEKNGVANEEVIKKLAKALDKGRECGIQEAIYRILGLSMTKFSEIVKFISTNHPNQREGLLKPNLDELGDDEPVFQNSLHDYYQDRPENKDDEDDEIDWDNMTLAEFVANFNIYKTKPASEKSIKLRNNRGYITKRGKECVIRYYLKYEDENDYHRALCILFLPFRDEMRDIHSKDVILLYKENETFIETVRSHFEKHRKLVKAIDEIDEKKEDNPDDSVDGDENFVAEETTTEEELNDFTKFVKNQADNQLRKYNEGKEMMSDENYMTQVNALNKEQRKIFDDFVERIIDQEDTEPFYLYIGGEAGTGKSFLMRLMIEAVRRLPHYSGQGLDKPYSLTIAPTGIAAVIIGGTTIESALSIQPQKRKSYVGSSASRNSNLRFLYEDLKVIFLDEVSMCGTDKLSIINLRLKDIMGNEKFMGGVSIVCTGDFGQLPPVNEAMIWKNSTIDGRCKLSQNYWNKYFEIFYLTEKMRSHDEEFSRICDKVRKGICDSEVLNYMNDHVKDCPNENDNESYAKGNLSVIVLTNNEREKINHEKLHALLPNEKTYTVTSSDESTNSRNRDVPQGPLTQTGQLEQRIEFKKGAPVMITSNHRQQRYKNNGIVNGARGYIDSIQTSKTNPNDIEIIWVCFNDENTGKLLREDNRALLKHHKPNNPKAVPIKRQRKQFQGSGSDYWLREQFPLTLCYSITGKT